MFPSSHSGKLLNYSFEPMMTGGSPTLHVTLEFKGGGAGKMELDLPSEWAGETHLERAITNLKAISSQTTITDMPSPSKKLLRFPSNAVVRISYDLVKDWKGPLASATRFRADLEPDYFHIMGVNALVHPQLDDFAVVDAHLDWQKLPASWSLATSFGTDERCQSFHGMWTDVENALFVGGDYRIQHTTISGNTLNFAIRGKWSFSDDEWVHQAQKIIEFERTFWRDNNFPYFLITLTPLDQQEGSTGGTALTNAFMEHLSGQASLSYIVLASLAHETFHSWNPHRMGAPPGQEETITWFYEGFTVYYTDLMLFRAGLLSFPEYVKRTNERLVQYEIGPGRDLSNQEFSRRHAKDGSFDQLDYRRGAVLALWLDSAIRRESKNKFSLDNLMFDLVRQEAAYKLRHKTSHLRLTSQRVFRAAAKYLSAKSQTLLQTYVEKGGSIPAPQSALGFCATLHQEATPTFDLGFDPGSLKGEKFVVFGVSPASEAFKAGLRNGQQLAGWNFSNNDPFKKVRLAIRTDSGKNVIEYYPQGPKVPVPQYQLDDHDNASNSETCGSAL